MRRKMSHGTSRRNFGDSIHNYQLSQLQLRMVSRIQKELCPPSIPTFLITAATPLHLHLYRPFA